MGDHDLKLTREAKLFRNNRSQAVRIPADWEFDGKKVRLRRDGRKVILEPIDENEPETLAELLASWDNIDEEFEIPPPPPLEPTEDFLNRNFPMDDDER